MVLDVYSKRWTLLLWSLSCLISNRSPSSCNATTKKKVYASDDNLIHRSYRLEDFFWTGSGDGPVLEDSFSNDTDDREPSVIQDVIGSWRTTTVFHTTTVLFATVYPNSCIDDDCKPTTSPVWTGSVEFSSPAHPTVFDIQPTRSHPELSLDFFNRTIYSEVTKTLTVTELVTDFHGIPIPTPSTKTVLTSSTVDLTTEFSTEKKSSDERGGAAYPRFDVDTQNTTVTNVPLDQRYWLLTVLKREDYNQELKVNVIEQKLSQLYRKAFLRQQEKHLGISNNSLTTSRPRRDRRIPEPVRVHIHNVTGAITNDPDGIGLLYSVTVAGKPVPAQTAANDMRLITMNEVVAELGYPVLTKAEPYLKGPVPIGARVKGRSRDTWLLIGSVIAAVLLLIVLATLFTFGLSHRGSQRNSARSSSNKRHVFEAEEGTSNVAFQEDSELKVKSDATKLKSTSAKTDLRTLDTSGGTIVSFADQRRESSCSSSCSGSSESSLVRMRHQQRKKDVRKETLDEKPRPRPRTRIRRVDNVNVSVEETRLNRMGISSAVSKDMESCGGTTTEGLEDVEYTPRLARTPTSYLSMPSVKAFPRGAKIPEPLNRVLEPISIRYLDGDADNVPRGTHRNRALDHEYDVDYSFESELRFKREKGMTRHASLEGDPGVIGPVVWKRRAQKANVTGKDVLDVTEIDGSVNIGKMRRRFNDLIDDAFSVFGSKNDSPEDRGKCPEGVHTRSTDSRIHSAVIRPAESYYHLSTVSRPKTTDSKRSLTALNQGPRGAWDSPNSATSAKPEVSTPTIDKTTVLVDSNLSPSDPAIPLIKAIKTELQKFDQGPTKLNFN